MTKNITTRSPIIRAFLGDEIVVDNFAGGGGASSGIERALGRSPDLAINHCAEAIAMHAANHPSTKHYIESVWEVDPREACGDKPVAFAWFSPTCTHFSKAKGTALGPEAIKQRGLAWVAVRWAHAVRPRIIALENVEEFKDWGPIHRLHSDGCTWSPKTDEDGPVLNAEGEQVYGCSLKKCQFGQPIKARKGETFRAFVSKLQRMGYVVEWKLLRACDYGSPTSRRRLFMVARCDGAAIVWPEATHGPGRKLAHRTAASCINWDDPCPSIFDRKKPLADKTLARIARGIRKFVLESARPFVIPVNHAGYDASGAPRADHRVHDIDEPMPTITGQRRGGHALVAPYLVHRSNGERTQGRWSAGGAPQAPRVYDAQQPLGTIMAQGQKHAACVAFLAKHYSDRPTGGWAGGSPADEPIGTVTARDHHSLVAANIVRYNGDRREGEVRGAQLEMPLPTQDCSNRFALVASFLSRYNGESVGQQPDSPLGTLDTTDRYALVTVTIDGEQYVIVDIGMRMLSARELFRAQGFDDSYTIDPDFEGKPLTKTAQIRMCGNSVPPDLAEAITRAQLEVPLPLAVDQEVAA